MVLMICALVGVGVMSVSAQQATPVTAPQSAGEPTTMVLVERVSMRTTVDSSEPGSSIGDMLIWGPNSLYDEANKVDTGAMTHGVCVWFNTDGDCLLYETITFPDGSTMETQGIQPGAAVPSERTIVGGSGEYLGVTGTIHIEPSDDFQVWTRIFEIWR
jgi:hypothetical protein